MYGHFEGFSRKILVHEVWVGVIFHDPCLTTQLVTLSPIIMVQWKMAKVFER